MKTFGKFFLGFVALNLFLDLIYDRAELEDKVEELEDRISDLEFTRDL